MRQASKYSMGGSPTLALKRAKNVERESWQAVNDASGQLRFAAGPDAMTLARAKR
jgi:hypothetical protein